MPRLTSHEIDEIFADEFDSYDEALIRHVSGMDDEPPQGLHRGGWIECSRHRDNNRFSWLDCTKDDNEDPLGLLD